MIIIRKYTSIYISDTKDNYKVDDDNVMKYGSRVGVIDQDLYPYSTTIQLLHGIT